MPSSDDFGRFQKGCALVTGFVECFLFGGVLFGWADLVFVMREEGIFHEKCNNVTRNDIGHIGETNTPSCKAQDDLFNDAFTIASFGRGIAALMVSFLLDYAGLRITRLIGIFSIILGGFFTGYSSADHPYYLFPGSILIALGGAEIRLADFKIANMFPKHKATVMSIYNGAFSGSGAVFLALKYAKDDGMDHSTFMYIWTGIAAIMVFPTFLLLPKSNIVTIDEAERIQQSAFNDDSGERQRLLTNDMVSENTAQASSPNVSFRDSICTVSYWLHVYSAATLYVGLSLYVASFNPWVDSFHNGEASYLSEIYGFCQLPMIFLSPPIGILMDYTIQRALREPEEAVKKRKLQQAGFVSLLCFTLTTTLLTACRIFSSITSLKLSLAVFTIAYPVMNAAIPAYMRIRFNQHHFNKLLGVMGTISVVYGAVQFPLFDWMERYPHACSIFVTAWMASTLANPLHLLCLKVK